LAIREAEDVVVVIMVVVSQMLSGQGTLNLREKKGIPGSLHEALGNSNYSGGTHRNH
jgi:hypothetical protein